MEIIYVLIGLSLCMAIGFLMAFIWAIKSGQQEDLISPAMRLLHEEVVDPHLEENTIKINQNTHEKNR